MTVGRLSERVRAFVAEHGSFGAAETALGVDRGYLHHLLTGRRKNPSDEVLAKLGLRRVVTYEPVDGARGEVSRFVEGLKERLGGCRDYVTDGDNPWAHGSTEQGFHPDTVVDYERLCGEIDAFTEEFKRR